MPQCSSVADLTLAAKGWLTHRPGLADDYRFAGVVPATRYIKGLNTSTRIWESGCERQEQLLKAYLKRSEFVVGSARASRGLIMDSCVLPWLLTRRKQHLGL
jgi:hypothetical protein